MTACEVAVTPTFLPASAVPDQLRRGGRLAAPGRALDRQHLAVEREPEPHDGLVVDSPSRSRVPAGTRRSTSACPRQSRPASTSSPVAWIAPRRLLVFSGPAGPRPRGRGGSAAVVFSTSRPAAASSSKTVPTFFAVSTSSASPVESFVSCTGNEYSYSRLFFSGPASTGSDSPPSAVRRARSAPRGPARRKTSHHAGRSSRRCQPTRSPSSWWPASCRRAPAPAPRPRLGDLRVGRLLGHRRRPRPVQRLQLGALLLQPVVQLAGRVDVLLVVGLDRGQLRCVAVDQPLLVHSTPPARWPRRPRATGRRTPRPS